MLLALALLVQDPLAVRADTIQARHDALHYDIAVAVSDTGRRIAAEVTTRWVLRAPGPVVASLDSSFAVLGTWVSDPSDRAMHRVRWRAAHGILAIPVAGTPGDTVTTRIRYRGTPRDGLILRRAPDGTLTAFADNWPDRAHRWFPSQDVPGDKATAAFRISAPRGYQVIANGTLERVDTAADGATVWRYRLDRPVSPYNLVFGLARFAVTRLGTAGCKLACVPISVWTYPQDSAFAVNGPFRRAGEIVDYFQDLVGWYPYPKLAHVESSTRFGGMENASSIFYDENAYRDRKLSEETVAHETAHQWFGDAVTEADWHHLWLSEGFATYFAALWVAHADGDSAGRADLAHAAQQVFRSAATERPIVDTAARDLMGLLNSNNYPKGAWVLHTLRHLVGDSAFWAGIRTYYARYRDSTVLSSDFARTMSEAAGTDLSWYFRQALLQPGYPELEVHPAFDSAARRLVLTVRQVQPGRWGTFRLPGLQFALDSTVVQGNVDGLETTLTFDGVAAIPRRIVVDPDGWWLLQARVVP
ncbi:MAG TPA: M1 family aminopeptidase [Gemmatimonadales bacterium]|nr:M1 family aminopeptidase [Gemmatimonadales bacterium]